VGNEPGDTPSVIAKALDLIVILTSYVESELTDIDSNSKHGETSDKVGGPRALTHEPSLIGANDSQATVRA
jgi:hypothetical protein